MVGTMTRQCSDVVSKVNWQSIHWCLQVIHSLTMIAGYQREATAGFRKDSRIVDTLASFVPSTCKPSVITLSIFTNAKFNIVDALASFTLFHSKDGHQHSCLVIVCPFVCIENLGRCIVMMPFMQSIWATRNMSTKIELCDVLLLQAFLEVIETMHLGIVDKEVRVIPTFTFWIQGRVDHIMWSSLNKLLRHRHDSWKSVELGRFPMIVCHCGLIERVYDRYRVVELLCLDTRGRQ